MNNQKSNDCKKIVMQEIYRLTEKLRSKVEALPVEDGDNTPEGRAIKKERKAIIKDSIHDLKRISNFLDAIEDEE